MPSSPVHMLLAYRMADSLGINDKADFLLGAIAPDSVNHGMEQASEAVRYRAHMISGSVCSQILPMPIQSIMQTA